MNHSARGSDGGIVCCYRCLVPSDGFIVQLRTNTMNTYSICFMKALCSSYACVKCFPDLTRKKKFSKKVVLCECVAMKVQDFSRVFEGLKSTFLYQNSQQPIFCIAISTSSHRGTWKKGE